MTSLVKSTDVPEFIIVWVQTHLPIQQLSISYAVPENAYFFQFIYGQKDFDLMIPFTEFYNCHNILGVCNFIISSISQIIGIEKTPTDLL